MWIYTHCCFICHIGKSNLKSLFFSRASLLAALLLLGCQKKVDITTLTPEELKQIKLFKKGKALHVSVCSTCHNVNPRLPGATGPAIYGSSLELLKRKVLHQKYPEGYRPKRKTTEMPAFVEFEKDISAIHIFLNQSY